jgi:ABC-2 type transport system permease protein
VPRAEVLAAFIISLLLGFVIGFLFEALIGLISFWTLEAGSLSFIVITLNYVLSGHMFPLDMIPEGWFRTLILRLPFQYLAYFPAKVYLRGESMTSLELWSDVGVAFVYAVLLYLAVVTAHRRGLRRYGAYGG